MTEPDGSELLELAASYALDAVSDRERAEVERGVDAAPADVSAAFHEEVRGIRETMARLSNVTAVEPPAHLRERVLMAVNASSRRNRWRTAALAAAAAVVIAIAAFGTGIALRPTSPPPSVAEQVFGATDVRSVSGVVPAGGTATVVYSRERDAAVLVMNGVSPPAADTVYQMWLLDSGKPRSAGTLSPAAVAPSTTDTILDLGTANTLAFTVEPGSGSEQPTGQIFVQLPLD
ncbi:anti-sigma factor domain-containing protein [Mycobacterium sp. DL440]|uniref:anti-sigma factor n=1 Tax=Mycobacterium sp. DL440 TaxID=2675523 RepID=UPI001424A07C|nr:anti-sigma factor [Mycobacterium sp. DL440]